METFGRNKSIALNMISQTGVFFVTFLINFFLTPFLVKSLGVDAYGFVGLSINIVGYVQIATVALNSMAGRFITIEYHKGDINKANAYFSSVVYANLIISAITAVILTILLVFLECVISIPEHLIGDVKLLFGLLSVNSIISLIFNVYSVPPFIKNRMDITATRNLVAQIIRLIVLVTLFSLFIPHLWYMGCSVVICSVYSTIANYIIKNRLTPELNVDFKLFDIHKIKTLLSSGVWNLISRIADLLQRGFDLLFANWFIGAAAMGILAITAHVPFMILQVLVLLSSSFAPSMTEDFAKGDIESIKNELYKSIRILSVIIIIPISALYVYGDVFYSLWVPSQDARLLQNLTICGTFALVFTSPLESFWNIFTVTNKIKVSSLFMLANSIAVFVTVILLLQFSDNMTVKMFIIASTRSIYGVFRGVLFLPMYGAHCLKLKKTFFYPLMIKPFLGLIATLGIMYCVRFLYIPSTWLTLLLMIIVIVIFSFLFASLFIFNKSDLVYLKSKLHDRFKK